MTAVEAALTELTALVPFLRWRVGAPADDEIVGGSIAADPDLLAALVAASRPAWDIDDDAVLASLWWQAYAYRVGGTTLACWLLTGSAPDPSRRTAVGIGRHRPSSVIYASDAGPVTDLDVLADRLFAGHLDGVAESLRARHRIGEQLLWGNAAAGVVSAMLAVAGAEGAPPVRARAADVLAALPHGIGALGAWADGEYTRNTCCLWYKTPSSKGGYCADCPIPGRR